MKIRWLGHACFELKFASGTTVVTDPFGNIGYPAIDAAADVVTVSHGHFDHNAAEAVKGNPVVISAAGAHTAAGLAITGIKSFHDNAQGKERGENVIFVFEGNGMRLCHLGDLGHTLSREQIEAIGKVDILFLPVGGYYTIDADNAHVVAEQLSPKVIIPMHYKTDPINFPIETAERFLARYDRVEKAASTAAEITPADLDGPAKVVVLKYQ